MQQALWKHVSSLPELRNGTVNLIHFRLDPPDMGEDAAAQLLNTDEHKRAKRFLRPLHQLRFAVGRARLRTILATYLGCAPREVEFEYGPHGKPALGGALTQRSLGFNLSHTGDDAVCAIAWERSLGVDIEVRAPRDVTAIAKRYFHEDESTAMACCQDQVEHARRFYQFWTAKEALLKGAGGGLTLPLNRCRFELDRVPFGLNFINLPDQAAQGWHVYPIMLSDDLSGAIAVDGPVNDWNRVNWTPLVG